MSEANLLDLTGKVKENETSPSALANRQAIQVMVAHQGAARSWHTCAEMAGSPHFSKKDLHAYFHISKWQYYRRLCRKRKQSSFS